MTKHDQLLKEIDRRGLKIERRGHAWRVFGPGVDLLVADLRWLVLKDLDAHRPD